MEIVLHPHARQRAAERGATELELKATIAGGERFSAKHGRTGFRRNFSGRFAHRERVFDTKQLEVYAVDERDHWLVITMIVKLF